MSWQRQTAMDPTVAFLKNVQEQKLLDVNLKELDNRWFSELKRLASDRLEATKQLTQLESCRRNLDYFDASRHMNDIRRYTDGIIQRVKYDEREKERDNFDFHPEKVREKFHPLVVPQFELSSAPTFPPLERSVSLCGSKLSLHIRHSKIKSQSDTNLHLKATFKDTTSRSNRTKDNGAKMSSDGSFPRLISGSRNEPRHRYLKQRMHTQITLPPVEENCRQRKLSI